MRDCITKTHWLNKLKKWQDPRDAACEHHGTLKETEVVYCGVNCLDWLNEEKGPWPEWDVALWHISPQETTRRCSGDGETEEVSPVTWLNLFGHDSSETSSTWKVRRQGLNYLLCLLETAITYQTNAIVSLTKKQIHSFTTTSYIDVIREWISNKYSTMGQYYTKLK